MRYYINTRSNRLILYKIDGNNIEPDYNITLMFDLVSCSPFVFIVGKYTNVNLAKLSKKWREKLAHLRLSIKTNLELFTAAIQKRFYHK